MKTSPNLDLHFEEFAQDHKSLREQQSVGLFHNAKHLSNEA